ncbi:MAG: type IV secretory system conjugative DNA transfer family protein [Pseudomonadota bacterium]
MFSNEEVRFGSAGLDDGTEALRKGMGQASHTALSVGWHASGHEIFSKDQSGIAMFAGARGGKGSRYLIGWLIDGVWDQHIINLDFKFQNGYVARNQSHIGRYGRRVFHFNPRKSHGVDTARINLTSNLTAASPNLEGDAMLHADNWCPNLNDKNIYFSGNAQRIIWAVAVVQAQLEGVVTLPRHAELLAQVGSDTEEWKNFEFMMTENPSQDIAAVGKDIEAWSIGGGESAGWGGILGEIRRAFACLGDPALRAVVSPPYDLDFSELTNPECLPTMVNIAEAQEFAQTSKPLLTAAFMCAGIYKRRAPHSGLNQLWLLDELGNFHGWKQGADFFSYMPGFNVRPVGVFQSRAQMKNLAPNAEDTIGNSCGTQIVFGTRSYNDALATSRSIGRETLEYDDFVLQERARHAKKQAMINAVMGHADLMETAAQLSHQSGIAEYRSQMARDVRSPDEIMNTPNGMAYVFMPGILQKPMLLNLRAYYERPELAGRYLDDRFHPPYGMVTVSNGRRSQQRRVLHGPVNRRYAHLPQYADGMCEYVEGYRF